MKFRILVRHPDPDGTELWEEEEREPGLQRLIRGYGRQPNFTGDINQWGRDIVAWFNKSEPPEKHRVFVRAEMLSGEEEEDE